MPKLIVAELPQYDYSGSFTLPITSNSASAFSGTRFRLTAAPTDAMGARGDYSISGFIHLAQIACVQTKVNMLRFARVQMNPLQPAQGSNRGRRRIGKLHHRLDARFREKHRELSGQFRGDDIYSGV